MTTASVISEYSQQVRQGEVTLVLRAQLLEVEMHWAMSVLVGTGARLLGLGTAPRCWPERRREEGRWPCPGAPSCATRT